MPARNSFAFHATIESPAAFLRRESRTIALAGGLFVAIMLAASLTIDPAFFYPRLQTDPLNYYLKAKALVETGSTAASWAVNTDPFAYAAMPGVMRAPLLLAFNDFDDQLHAMQMMNIVMVAGVALLSAFILSWALPQNRHPLAIIFAFVFTALSPVWLANVFLPLADAPYAAVTLGAVVVITRVLRSSTGLRHHRADLAIAALLFVTAFLIRFTAPVLLVFAFVLARGRWGDEWAGRRARVVSAAVVGGLVLLIALNSHAIFGRYITEPIFFLVDGDKPGMLMNLLASAIPSQIIPTFQLGFIHPPLVSLWELRFTTSAADAIWALAGLLVSAAVILGAVRARSRFLPELLYVLSPLPILVLMVPSTARYLMSYQPFFWIFFYCGTAYVVSRFAPRVSAGRGLRVGIAAATVILGVVALGLRAWKSVGSASARAQAVSAATAPRYVSDVSSTFRSLRNFIETLPRDRTLLIARTGSNGRWKAIADRDYYMPDSSLSRVARERDVYLLVECGTAEICQDWPSYRRTMEEMVQRHGEYVLQPVFAAASARARVEVLRVKPVS